MLGNVLRSDLAAGAQVVPAQWDHASRAIADELVVAEWLSGRIADALDVQARGWNPRALMFPGLSGVVFCEQNLRNLVWAPAARELGWQMEQPGSNVQLLRFTLHSLRDRYANTALHVWKYTEEVLLQQGSWKDPETVRRFYSGITDQTLAQAMAIHGWGTSH